MKLPHIILAITVIASAYPVVHAKGASAGGGGRSVSISSSRSYSSSPSRSYSSTRLTRPITPVYTSTPKNNRSKSSGEYEYFALADCKRVFRPINGYRCLDRN